jgi:hypothetical protein
MLIYNVGFINEDNLNDETQLDLEEHEDEEAATIELLNLVLSLKDEMGIKEITYIEYVGCEEEE